MNRAIHQFSLRHFRSHERWDISIDDPLRSPMIALVGPNGAGKTNILEALSFLIPGRGLRRTKLADIRPYQKPDVSWLIQAYLWDGTKLSEIETGLDQMANQPKRYIRVDQMAYGQQKILSQVCSVLWLTPEMDRLLAEGQSERRRFFDRLVMQWNPHHYDVVAAYEKAFQERQRILEQPSTRTRDQWLASIEEHMVNHGIGVAANRFQYITALTPYLGDSTEYNDMSHFPQPRIECLGLLETMLQTFPALVCEEAFRKNLEQSRKLDQYQRSSVEQGPEKTNFRVWHQQKNIPAHFSSTGEQKALMLRLILGHLMLLDSAFIPLPLFLLDEASAHLDQQRRSILFCFLSKLGIQTWMTGTDPGLFLNASLENEGTPIHLIHLPR